MEESKTMKTPMSSSIKLDKDEKDKSIDSTMYRGMIDADFSSCRVERKALVHLSFPRTLTCFMA
ncbi:hypothetical protein CK203_026378 [Vitis vinifera]|uniref:Uncharacterized protein n=1 Tax=Vitis vinifera TaxID=29760 RepID=A0A438IVI8_VITVI|nr:hypothetical protein CK203_026378 [Vitis vinifera]